MNKYRFYYLSFVMLGSMGIYAQSDAAADTALVTRVPKAEKKVPVREVKGKVWDANSGVPLSGAMVRVSGIDGYSALTDENGMFTLSVPLHATVVEVTAPDFNRVMVGLRKGESLGDIRLYSSVAPGLYEDGNNILGNSMTSDFGRSTALNISEEIGAKLGADVYTVGRSGTPGIGSYMTIGGVNSLLANSQPLIVVDGVILDQQYSRTMLHSGFYNDFLTNLNVNDIEKVEVMRNGTAIYGAKGANGVIFISTKRNKSLATRIDATISAGVELQPKMYDLMNGGQFKTYASEMLRSTGTTATNFKFLDPSPTNYWYNKYNNDTDWSDEVYREAFTQNYGVNVQGGGEVASYNLSLNYTMAQSTLKENDMDRLNIRFNTDIELAKWFKLRFDASYVNMTRDLRDQGAPDSYDNGTVSAPNFLALVKSPMLSPYSYAAGAISGSHLDIDDEDYLNEAMSHIRNANYKLANPSCINEYGSAENKNRFENSFVNIAVTPRFEINRHLTLSSLFSYSLTNTNNKYYIPLSGVPDYYVKSMANYMQNEIRSLFAKQNYVMSDTRLAWNNQYGAHDISLSGGFRYQSDSYSLNTQLGYNTGNDKTPAVNNSEVRYTDGVSNDWASMTWYAQAAYNYAQRYFVEGSLALQSSSLFGRQAKDGFKMGGVVWGVFPSLQAGWMMSNEKWFNCPGIDKLKIIAGYSMSGNDDIASDASRTYFGTTSYLGLVTGLTVGNIGNPSLQWETTRRWNAGLDVNVLHNRMNVKFNYFHSTTDNLLTYKSLKAVAGIEKNWSNGGALKNHGFDVTVNAHLLAKRNWNWTMGASVGHYDNELTSLPDNALFTDTELYGATVRSQIGNPVNMFYGYKTAPTSNGHIVYATTEEAKADNLYVLDANGVTRHYFGAGDVKYVDVNGDGCIDANDRTFIGNPNPDFYGNIFTSLQWKRLRLDVNFNYSVGGDVFNYVRQQLESGSRFFNQSQAMLSRWTAEGQATDMPRVSYGDVMGNAAFSDRWIEDGSYLRLKNVTLSYDFPINNPYIQGLSVWGTASNLFTLTRYLGTDPEFSMGNSVFEQGIDRGLLSRGRSFTIGVKINL
ncbi:MAG: SusC/RagA family TonB-linked outer membrane protein [Clostridium sp.]|nr:SusC/RagA family TonB-linked outer membrane protein [Clostridium sp.]